VKHGIVIKSTGSWYRVRTDEGLDLECKVKGTFRLKEIRSTNPVAVGDGVTIAEREGETAYITDIDERKNYIIRKASNLSKQSHILAANIDLAALVVTVAHPVTDTTFIDRFLASAEAYNVPAILIFNKTDLLNDEERETLNILLYIYKEAGYETICTSAIDLTGIETLQNTLQGKTTLLAGNSGVGKSKLLNLLIPEAHAKTAEISEAHEQGTHTTTYSELYPFGNGAQGGIIDIPGIKGFGTFDMEPEEISHYFREIFHISAGCRFGNCTHTNEPGCAVLEALENHRLAPSRYASYLSMLEDKDAGKYRS